MFGCNREDNKPPVVKIEKPIDESVFHERDTVSIEVSASDNVEIFEVKVFVDEIEYFTSHSEPFDFLYFTNGKVGEHTVKATAMDPSGNLGESQFILFTVATNNSPLPKLSINPETGSKGSTFTLDASGTKDSEDDLGHLMFRWDWNGDANWDTDFSSTAVVTHIFEEPGFYVVRLEVKDRQGNKSSTSADLIVKGIFEDPRDGNLYETVVINDKEWFAQNLRLNQQNSWCFNDIESNCALYGRLYNWETGVNVCPDGWHLPSDNEWADLESFAGMDLSELYKNGDRRSGNVGTKLKAKQEWGNVLTGTDVYGLSIKPSGYTDPRGSSVLYLELGQLGRFWSATQLGGTDFYYRSFSKASSGISRDKGSQLMGFSVRCIKGSGVPVVGTQMVSGITDVSVLIKGKLFSMSGSDIESQGLCYGQQTNPTIDDQVITVNSGLGEFNCKIEGLVPNTTYFARAFAKNQKAIGYGDVLSFKTSVGLPSVITGDVSGITSISAICTGEVTYDGYGSISSRGICYSVENQPSISDSKIQVAGGLGKFTATLNSLSSHQIYYYRAYVINQSGVSYGEIKQFETLIGLPSLETLGASNITRYEATSGGKILSKGGGIVSEMGVCFNIWGNPDITSNKILATGEEKEFRVRLAGLEVGTKYFIKAYAINEVGVAYGQEIQFKTRNDSSSFIDPRDNQTYSIVKVGDQWWMSQNLNFSTASGSYCYKNDASNCTKYGRLYSKNISVSVCPEGWHLPSALEIELMLQSIGTQPGKHIKATHGWSPLSGDNLSGLNALSSGFARSSLDYGSEGEMAYWWTSTVLTHAINKSFLISGSSDNIGWSEQSQYALSVRCIKDN